MVFPDHKREVFFRSAKEALGVVRGKGDLHFQPMILAEAWAREANLHIRWPLALPKPGLSMMSSCVDTTTIMECLIDLCPGVAPLFAHYNT